MGCTGRQSSWWNATAHRHFVSACALDSSMSDMTLVKAGSPIDHDSEYGKCVDRLCSCSNYVENYVSFVRAPEDSPGSASLFHSRQRI